ncbi:MAG: hypothetical protein KIG18_05860 [Candidatus Methanomethylophilaceae archaeon]|nr:hypothetical protein [Candidatus Methanomethylophilaceae archaeon]
MNEHMKISEETIEEMERTVKEVIRTLGMEIDNGDMIAHEREFTYDLELRTGYGWRVLRIWATLEPDDMTRIWAASHRPGSMRSREESEDDEIEIICKDPVKGIAGAVRYALVDHITPKMREILEERARMKSPTEGLMEIKRDAQKLLDRIDEQMRGRLGPA